MYLKALTLKGFKSFLERTRLSFDPGLTVVVGPNGSGKSNVSDAILWVLGEQSAKTLRGQAMEDVIFAGSAQRHAVGVAEVTLVLDNSDHALPLDFSEVAITRRMYRSGESEYLLNGAQVRLRDIRDLLYDMGLGRDTYSIISQGRLGEVLQSRPEERRALVEEAAGIAKHRQRKERAERKLKRLDEDVQRIHDYVRMLRRELRPLEKQVDRARAMEELQERRGILETTLAVDDVRRLQGQWDAISKRRTEAEAAAELASYRLREKERELQDVKRLLEEKGLFVGDLEEQRHRSQQALSGASAALRLLDEKGRHVVERLSEARRRIGAADRELQELGGELAEAQTALDAARAESDALEARLERLVPADGEARERARIAQAALDAARERMRRAQRASDGKVLERSRIAQSLANADVADRLIADRLAELDASIRAASQDAAKAERALADLDEGEAQARRDSEALAADRGRAQEALSKARSERTEADAEAVRAKAELESLEAMGERDVASDALQRALQALAPSKGRLIDLLDVPEELSRAVASYLGDDLRAFPLGDAGELPTMLEAAAMDGVRGRASLMVAPSSKEGGEGELVVKAKDASAEPLARALFAGFARARDAGEGRELVASGRARSALGEDGSVVLPDGRIRLGDADAGAAEVLGRSRRMAELTELAPKLAEAKERAATAFDEAERHLEDLRAKEAEALSALAALAVERDGILRETGRQREVLDRATAERERLEREREEARGKVSKERERLAELEGEIAEADEELQRATGAIAGLDDEAVRARREADSARDALEAARISAMRAEERATALTSQAASLERRLAEAGAERGAILEGASALQVIARRVEPLHRIVDALHEEALEKATLLRDRSSVAEADSASLKETVAAAEREVDEARDGQTRAQADIAQAQTDSQIIELQVNQAVERVRELGAMGIEEAFGLEAPSDRGAMERELSLVLARIEAMGPVNMVALSQFEEGRARLSAVQAELDDLTAARDSLNKISRAIDRKMRARFLETFKAVDANFSDVFRTLFGGGDARLEMTDPGHPEETGIEVRAQPPGKRVTKMTLLSGGEQSLTALALLFAVYRTRTVPFYVFDEVEQALDDRNLDKLLDSLDTLKRQTQLIVISHQRRTMEQADVLYGVSMGADGVSRAVSQRLADFRKPKPGAKAESEMPSEERAQAPNGSGE